MQLRDYLLLLFIALLVYLALRILRRNKGGCSCGGCSECQKGCSSASSKGCCSCGSTSKKMIVSLFTSEECLPKEPNPERKDEKDL